MLTRSKHNHHRISASPHTSLFLRDIPDSPSHLPSVGHEIASIAKVGMRSMIDSPVSIVSVHSAKIRIAQSFCLVARHLSKYQRLNFSFFYRRRFLSSFLDRRAPRTNVGRDSATRRRAQLGRARAAPHARARTSSPRQLRFGVFFLQFLFTRVFSLCLGSVSSRLVTAPSLVSISCHTPFSLALTIALLNF